MWPTTTRNRGKSGTPGRGNEIWEGLRPLPFFSFAPPPHPRPYDGPCFCRTSRRPCRQAGPPPAGLWPPVASGCRGLVVWGRARRGPSPVCPGQFSPPPKARGAQPPRPGSRQSWGPGLGGCNWLAGGPPPPRRQGWARPSFRGPRCGSLWPGPVPPPFRPALLQSRRATVVEGSALPGARGFRRCGGGERPGGKAPGGRARV